jgi:hypothetical protein
VSRLLPALLLLFACAASPPPEPQKLRPRARPNPLPTPGSCAEACQSLRARGCSAGRPAEDGASCEVVCADVEALREGTFLRASAQRPCDVGVNH